MTGPTLDDAPTVDDLLAIECPIRRAALITEFGRKAGTIPGPLARLRIKALRSARFEMEKSAGYIAAHVGLSRARIFQLTKPAGTES